MDVYCGIGWASDHHDVALVGHDGALLAKARIGDDTAGLQPLIDLLIARDDAADRGVVAAAVPDTAARGCRAGRPDLPRLSRSPAPDAWARCLSAAQSPVRRGTWRGCSSTASAARRRRIKSQPDGPHGLLRRTSELSGVQNAGSRRLLGRSHVHPPRRGGVIPDRSAK